MFGPANVPVLALVDFGQVTFVFFVLVAMLISLRGGKPKTAELVFRLITSPVVIAIFAGLLVGVLKSALSFGGSSVYTAFSAFLNLLANLTVPLICIVIGYQLEIARG